MCAFSSPQTDKSSPLFHQKSYRLFSEFMDAEHYGSMMLVLRQKNIADPAARRRAGLELVDIFSIGPDPASPQVLRIRSLRRGERRVELEHTYMYWTQLTTLNEFLNEQYQRPVPHVHRSKRENGLLACVELDGCHMAPLPDRYVVWTFRLKARVRHRCPEETPGAPARGVVSLGELGGAACPYCLAEKLNIDLE